jgi:hypothetical protein
MPLLTGLTAIVGSLLLSTVVSALNKMRRVRT